MMHPTSFLRKRAKGLLLATVTLAILWMALAALDWDELLTVLQGISISTLLLCFVLNVVCLLLMSIRWSIIASTSDILRFDRAKFMEMLTFTYAGLFNLVTPGALGADIYRVAKGRLREGGRAGSAGYVTIERLMALVAQMTVYCVSMAVFVMSGNGAPLSYMFVMVAAIFVAVILVILSLFVLLQFVEVKQQQWLKPFFAEIFAAFVRAMSQPAGKLAFLAVFSLVPAAAWVLTVWALTLSVPLGVDVMAFTMCVILTEFIRLVPISIQGIGVREGAFALLISMFGGYASGAFVVAAVVYVTNMVAIALLTVMAGLAIALVQD